MKTNVQLYRDAEASLRRLQMAMQSIALRDRHAESACQDIAEALSALLKAEANVARTDFKTKE